MNEALQNLEIKVENGGSTPQGRVSAAEWNVLVAGVKALDLAGFDEAALRDYLDQYDYITRPELNKALEGIGGSSGGGIAYPLTWSGYSQGMWDGSAPANIAIPSLMSQLTNDSDYITTASVNSLLTEYLPITGGTMSDRIDFDKTYGSILTIRDGRYGQSAVISIGYTESEGDTIKLHIPTAGSYDEYFLLTHHQGATLTTDLAIYGKLHTKDSYRQLYHDSYNGQVAHSILNNIASPYGLLTRIYGNGDVSLQAQRESTNNEYFNLLLNEYGGNVVIGGELHTNDTISFVGSGNTAIQFPDGEYIDRWGNVRLGSSSGSWNVIQNDKSLLRILSDATLDLNPVGSVHRFRLIANNSYSYLQAGSPSGNQRGAMCLSGYYASLLTSLRLNTEEVVITGNLAGEEVGRMRIVTDGTYSYIQAASTAAGHQGAICLSGYFSTQLTSLKLHAAETTITGNVVAMGGVTAKNISDRRLKQNIRAFDAISILRGMGGVHAYEYVDTEVARDARYTGTHFGFIYQDVKGSELERMCLKREDGYGTLNYLDSNLISVVAGGVLSLDDRVRSLEHENEQLREEINRLNARLS